MVGLSSELHTIKERISKIESLLNRTVSREEVKQYTLTGSELVCGTCDAELTPSESLNGLKICRSCRAQNISELMRPREWATSSPITRHSAIDHSRVERIQDGLDIIELLVLAKQYYTYNDLGRLLGLPSTVLARYVKGHVLPAGKRSREIRRSLLEAVKLGARVTETLRKCGVEAVSQMNMNPRLLWFIVQHIVYLNAGRRITKVMTATEEGVPLATLVSYRLGVPLIVATPHKRTGTRKTIEIEFTSDVQLSVEPYVRTMHVPSEALKKNDAVLIITDCLSDGALQMALEKLARAAGADVAAIWATTLTTDSWMKTECPIDSFAKLNLSGEENCTVESLNHEVENGEQAVGTAATPAPA